MPCNCPQTAPVGVGWWGHAERPRMVSQSGSLLELREALNLVQEARRTDSLPRAAELLNAARINIRCCLQIEPLAQAYRALQDAETYLRTVPLQGLGQPPGPPAVPPPGFQTPPIPPGGWGSGPGGMGPTMPGMTPQGVTIAAYQQLVAPPGQPELRTAMLAPALMRLRAVLQQVESILWEAISRLEHPGARAPAGHDAQWRGLRGLDPATGSNLLVMGIALAGFVALAVYLGRRMT